MTEFGIPLSRRSPTDGLLVEYNEPISELSKYLGCAIDNRIVYVPNSNEYYTKTWDYRTHFVLWYFVLHVIIIYSVLVAIGLAIAQWMIPVMKPHSKRVEE